MSNETETESPVGEITELSVEEVSLVDRAANRKTFLIVRSEDGTAPEAVVEKQDEELLEQSQGVGSEAPSEGGLGGAGESLGSGQEQAGEDRAVAQASTPATLSTEEILKALQETVEVLRADQQGLQRAFEANPVVSELRAELQKAQTALAEATTLNRECRALLARVGETLAPTAPVAVAKAATECTKPSNVNGSVLESKLVTEEPTGFLRTSKDLNLSIRREKSKK